MANDFSKEVSEITNDLQELADKLIKEEFPIIAKEDAVALKSVTQLFLDRVNLVYWKIQGFNDFKKAEHDLKLVAQGKKVQTASQIEVLKQTVETYKTYKIADEEFRIFISLLDKYQLSLNQYLGQSIRTIYAFNTANGAVEIYELVGDISDAVKQDIASRGGGMSARFSASARNNESVFNKIITAQGDNVTNTYKEVLARGEKSREVLTKKGMLILWCPNSVWKKMMVAGGAGDITEAYLSFILDDERMNMFLGSMENDIDTFMLSGVKFVDNLPGLLKGDFSVGSVQFAAKTEGASMMGYKQVLDLANKINKSTAEEVTQIMFTEYDKIVQKEAKGSGRRNKMQKFTNDSIDTVLQEWTQERINSMYK